MDLPADAELGELVVVGHVRATNVFRDIREAWRNLVGGDLQRYTILLEETLASAQAKFRAELLRQGYDGAVGVRFSHPGITERGADVVIYGTGIRRRERLGR